MKYGVELHGWPLAKLKNPSNIMSLGDLESVSKVLKDGTCGWVRLRNDELEEWLKECEEEVRHGRHAPLKWVGAASAALAGKKWKRTCGGKVGRKNRLVSFIDVDDDVRGGENLRHEPHS